MVSNALTMADVASSISSSSSMNTTASPVLSEGHGLISPKVKEAMDRIFPESTSELFDKSPKKNGERDNQHNCLKPDRNSVNVDVNGCTTERDENRVDSPVVPSETSPVVPSTERRIVTKIKMSNSGLSSYSASDLEESNTFQITMNNFDDSTEERDSDDMSRPFTKKKKHKKNDSHVDVLSKDASGKNTMNNSESHVGSPSITTEPIQKNVELINGNDLIVDGENKTKTTGLAPVKYSTVPSRAHSGIKLPVPRKKFYNVYADQKNIQRSFPECFVILNTYNREFPKHCSKDIWSEMENILPLSARMKFLKIMCNENKINCPKNKRKGWKDTGDSRYKNIFEENYLSEDEFQLTRGGKSLRRRNKKVNYQEPADVIDLVEESKNRDKDPNYCVDNDSDSDDTAKKPEGTRVILQSQNDRSQTVVGHDGKTQVYVYPRTAVNSTTTFASSSLPIQGQPTPQLPSTSASGVRPQYCMMKVDGKDMLVQLSSGPAGMQQVMAGGKRYVLQTPMHPGGAVPSGTGLVMPPSTMASAPPGVLLQSANRVPVMVGSGQAAGIRGPGPAAPGIQAPVAPSVRAPMAPSVRAPMAPSVRAPMFNRTVRNPVPGPDDVIWELLTRSENTDRATCKFCPEVFMVHNSTTSILRHMQKKHPKEIKSARQKQEAREKEEAAKEKEKNAIKAKSTVPLPAVRPAPVTPVSTVAPVQTIQSPPVQTIQSPPVQAVSNAMAGRTNKTPGPNDVIWELMTRSEKQDRATCKHCKEVFMIHNSTTAILRHLQKAHPKEIKEARQKREQEEQKEARKNAPLVPMGRGTIGAVGRPHLHPRPPLHPGALIPPSQCQGLAGRNLRLYVPGCSATNTPAHYTMLATMPQSSPLTRLSASSSLLPQRKRVVDELTPEQKAAKRRKLEKKYPLPPGVVIKTEPEEAPATNSAPTTSQPGMRSLLQTSIQSMFIRPQGPGAMQSVRISPQLASALATRHIQPGSNIMIRAGGPGQTLLVPVTVSNSSLACGVTVSSTPTTTMVSSSGPPDLLATSSTSATDQTVIAAQQAIDNLRTLVKAQESRGLTGDRLDKLRTLLAKKEADLKALQAPSTLGNTPPPPTLSSDSQQLVDPVDGSIAGTEDDPFVID